LDDFNVLLGQSRHGALDVAQLQAQRQVLLLTALDGKDYGEIAATLDVPSGIVRLRLSRARATVWTWIDMNGERPAGAGAGAVAG
jgi:DNA-directed RNA polymerase specialized sigma24 family protein